MIGHPWPSCIREAGTKLGIEAVPVSDAYRQTIIQNQEVLPNNGEQRVRVAIDVVTRSKGPCGEGGGARNCRAQLNSEVAETTIPSCSRGQDSQFEA
jgi:hypothetical protein